MISDVPESSEHEKLYCLMYMYHTVCLLYCLMYVYHTVCLFFTTHYAYGSFEEEEREEEQKAASQTVGSEAPDGDSVML